MDEITKALGPWPILQIFFGLAVLGLGVFSIIRGLSGKEHQNPRQVEDRKSQWEAYKQLEHIEDKTQRLVHLMEKQNELTVQLIETINRWGSFFFNKTQ